jgi:hypothetical protein
MDGGEVRIWFEDGMTEKLTSVEKSASGLAGGPASVGTVPLKGGRDSESKGPSCRPTSDKARAFWARQAEARRKPGHCGRCGKASETRTCPECRKWHRENKAAKRVIPAAVAVSTLDGLLRRVGSLEIAVGNLKLRQREAYRRGYSAGQRNRRMRLARRIEGLRGEHSAHLRGCVMGREDKAATCHWAGGQSNG